MDSDRIVGGTVMVLVGVVMLLGLLFMCGVAFSRETFDGDGGLGDSRHVERPHPCYQSPLIDCVELMKQQGTLAYCAWAGKMAGLGAWEREQGTKLKDVRLATPRPLTANEHRTVLMWLRFGWLVPQEPYFVIDAAEHFCRRLYDHEPPLQMSYLSESK